jgi:hypothetical protein
MTRLPNEIFRLEVGFRGLGAIGSGASAGDGRSQREGCSGGNGVQEAVVDRSGTASERRADSRARPAW